MEFSKHCCKIAVLAAVIAIILVSLLGGYDILDWAMLSWLGAAIVLAAAWLCTKCRDDQEEKDEDNP